MKQRIKQLLPVKWMVKGELDEKATVSLFGNAATKILVWEFLKKVRSQISDIRVKYITKPFLEALCSAEERICDIWDTSFQDEGIMIYGNVIFLYILDAKSSGNHNIQFLSFDKEGTFLNMAVKSSIEDKIVSNPEMKNKEERSLLIKSTYTSIIATSLFIKYAKVESKITKPKEKIHFQTCRYFNDSDETIELYDCTWFTNLIKGEGFNVRGHFRLQPYKDRTELIWINTFGKTGYTRKAKMLSIDP